MRNRCCFCCFMLVGRRRPPVGHNGEGGDARLVSCNVQQQMIWPLSLLPLISLFCYQKISYSMAKKMVVDGAKVC